MASRSRSLQTSRGTFTTLMSRPASFLGFFPRGACLPLAGPPSSSWTVGTPLPCASPSAWASAGSTLLGDVLRRMLLGIPRSGFAMAEDLLREPIVREGRRRSGCEFQDRPVPGMGLLDPDRARD